MILGSMKMKNKRLRKTTKCPKREHECMHKKLAIRSSKVFRFLFQLLLSRHYFAKILGTCLEFHLYLYRGYIYIICHVMSGEFQSV